MAKPSTITQAERRLSKWRAPPSFADNERRETVARRPVASFADFKALEDLLQLQAVERACLAYMERNGSKGREMEYMRVSVEAREIEIRNLRANDR
jgi:hypothetical protein